MLGREVFESCLFVWGLAILTADENEEVFGQEKETFCVFDEKFIICGVVHFNNFVVIEEVWYVEGSGTVGLCG